MSKIEKKPQFYIAWAVFESLFEHLKQSFWLSNSQLKSEQFLLTIRQPKYFALGAQKILL